MDPVAFLGGGQERHREFLLELFQLLRGDNLLGVEKRLKALLDLVQGHCLRRRRGDHGHRGHLRYLPFRLGFRRHIGQRCRINQLRNLAAGRASGIQAGPPLTTIVVSGLRALPEIEGSDVYA